MIVLNAKYKTSTCFGDMYVLPGTCFAIQDDPDVYQIYKIKIGEYGGLGVYISNLIRNNEESQQKLDNFLALNKVPPHELRKLYVSLNEISIYKNLPILFSDEDIERYCSE